MDYKTRIEFIDLIVETLAKKYKEVNDGTWSIESQSLILEVINSFRKAIRDIDPNFNDGAFIDKINKLIE